MNLPCDIEVEVSFLSTEHGGRRSAVSSDYRGQFYYDGDDWDARFVFLPFNSIVQLGETVVSHVAMVSPAAHLGRLCEGKVFLVREGNRVVGYGKVVKLVGLEESARRAWS